MSGERETPAEYAARHRSIAEDRKAARIARLVMDLGAVQCEHESEE